LYTGFRLGECWRIECRDINLELGTITAWKTKNGHPRTIPIVDKIRPILERKIFEAGENGKLFPTADNRWFESAWNRIKRLLGLEKDVQLVPHALRHTCASRLAQRGVSMMVIKEWMGHSNIKTTMRYTHLSPKDLQEAAKIFSL
ncbi:MAG: site-specific integrase, partial [Bilophila wadsworthia]